MTVGSSGYWLRWAIAETYAVWFSILALWCWYYTDHHNQQQLWDYLISALIILFAIGPPFQLFWTGIIQWMTTSGCVHRRSTTAIVLSAIGLFLPASWGWYDICKDEQKLWYCLKSDTIVVSTSGFLHLAFRSGYSINQWNKQRWY